MFCFQSRIPVYVGHHPAGTSIQNIAHFAQVRDVLDMCYTYIYVYWLTDTVLDLDWTINLHFTARTTTCLFILYPITNT